MTTNVHCDMIIKRSHDLKQNSVATSSMQSFNLKIFDILETKKEYDRETLRQRDKPYFRIFS